MRAVALDCTNRCRFARASSIRSPHTFVHIDILCTYLPTPSCLSHQAALSTIRGLIDSVITEDTAWAKSAVAARQQECFAVRPGIFGAYVRYHG